jgi:molybdopterin converting factor subunit 1
MKRDKKTRGQTDPQTIKLNLLFFATIRDHMGARQLDLEMPLGTGVAELKQELVARIPEAAPAIDNALVSINREYAFGEEPIPDGAEVAFFPHVSGG